jgi:hypothetical protein
MAVIIHPHARERMEERGATDEEVIKTVEEGEEFPAKFGRVGLRRNFTFENAWRGRNYKTKQLEVYGVKENNDFMVISVIVKYF